MNGPDEGSVVVATRNAEIADLVAAAGAALNLNPIVVAEPEALAGLWGPAPTVFVGADVAAEVAALGLPPRERVHLVGRDVGAMALWSMPLRAEVIVLPEGRAWLSSVLARAAPGRVAEVVTVLGGSGGVGASTFAAALAWRAAERGRRVALVDIDPVGGGIDLLLGAEQLPGWRWPRLRGADGFLGDLGEFLPLVDGVAVVSMARGPDPDLAREPLAAVLGSLQRSHDLVVVDAGRGPSPATRECLSLTTSGVLVVAAAVRGVAAATQVARQFDLGDARAVLRERRGGRVPGRLVEDNLGLPVVARVADDAAVADAAERGHRPPLRRRRGGLGAAADAVLDGLREAA